MDKKQLKIPTYFLVIIAVLILSIIFIFVVQVPFSQKLDTYNRDHASATSQISKYNDYLNRANEVSTKNAEMKAEYEANSRKLFSNANMSPDDIRDALTTFNYELVSLDISEGVVDPKGRSAVAGEPLYLTNVKYRFVGTEDNIRSTLDYLETQSEGAYFINDMSITLPKAAGSNDETVKTFNPTLKYEANINMSLYYFNNKVAPVKKASSSSASSK
ncbi:MAG: hypothetical protein II059_04115 [Clostridia bacterium]|nr:hypothetical protein [Clostridia bacterium]